MHGDATRFDIIQRLGNGIETFNSAPTAIYSFLSHPRSFEETVLYAIGLGGDADTIGAMTWAISGVCHEVNAILITWKKKPEDCEQIEKPADEMFLVGAETVN